MHKTYLACLTPPGRGAIATLALRGPDAWHLVRQLVTLRSDKKQLPSAARVERVWLGQVGDETHGRDEVVVRARPGERVELHCHGGTEVVRMLQNLFVARGAVFCSWEEFNSLAAGDPLAAQANIALARAATTRTAGILLDQCQGALSSALREIQAAIARKDSTTALSKFDSILRYASVGLHLTRPRRVAVAGAPNVGKSTLINALVGFQRAVVSSTPGTTRDVVTTAIAIDGWPVELADTAGWRESPDALEREGIERGAVAVRQADLCLWLLDASQAPVWPADEKRVQVVINKIDLPAAWDLQQRSGALQVSAKTGQGLDELLTSISRRLVPEVPPPGSPVPFSEHIVASLEAARDSLTRNQMATALEILQGMLERERETPARRG